MKKNVMMRVASALLVAVLMTTCAISGTFAKYTTSDSATDSARVAKWGVTVDVVGETAFAKKYNDKAADDGVKVISEDKVVAPGTDGTLTTVTITGKPEVAVEVLVTVDLDLGNKWEVNSAVYCPLVFKVGDTTIQMDNTITTTAALEEAVEKAVKDALVAQHNADETIDDSLTVTWAWAFSTGATNEEKKANDAKDTALAAAAPTIAFTCEVIVNQVD